MTAASALRKRLSDKNIVVVPGGGSPLEMKLIAQAGFEAGYLSGYATSATRYGLPDIGLMALGEIENALAACRRVTELPLIVDCDTGYGDVINVRHTVRVMRDLGAAAVQIEDQVWPKRCGHMDNKIVEPREVALKKLKAAVKAADGSDLLVIARTDARGPHGLDEALERCRMFHDAGADVLFVDGPHSVQELERIGRGLPGPLLANMSETGKTPLLSASELQQLGFAIALFPSSTVRLAVKTIQNFLTHLKQTGDSSEWVPRMASLAETNAALDIDVHRDFEADILKELAQEMEKQA
ncbi:isocitrate lyase/PEP mutase family protein [Paraburkholderia antibiotica]|uniref:Carboxyvinyl-carboxyphosphonate phosphorylmutase n=1 Tax=Paraburkholderia antibiotica TaxID=2728839 RepID=A0A7X9X349_9BURK|nr:isocitrate lyase/phosphoenolpyruvate mutase family protein [Paraburkholderia antibiotica]NML30379.1 carboxyvinyl-carboxyphosphonate phosphorylmutase [Paraburkholderia antibiotica]